MAARTHLFVAVQKAPFGEVVLGARIARDLAARGENVVFAAPPSVGVVVERAPFRTVPIEDTGPTLVRTLVDLARAERASSVVLLDVTSVYMLLAARGLEGGFASAFDAALIGLDVWDRRRTGHRWDFCGARWDLSPRALEVKRLLVPVPFASPTGTQGAFNAMVGVDAADERVRRDAREDLGLGHKDRLLLLTSALWQSPALQAHAHGRRLAERFPELCAYLLGRAGAEVHVVHVGPAAFPLGQTLGRRYTWLTPRSPQRFARLLSASDALLSFNFSATTIGSAIAMGLPVLLGINSYAGATADEVLAHLASSPATSPELRRWVESAVPLCPFRVWPLGLHAFLAPLAKGNPYVDTLRTVEVLEEEAFVTALRALLFDEAARGEIQERQAAYRMTVEPLPSGADLVVAHLEGRGAGPGAHVP